MIKGHCNRWDSNSCPSSVTHSSPSKFISQDYASFLPFVWYVCFWEDIWLGDPFWLLFLDYITFCHSIIIPGHISFDHYIWIFLNFLFFVILVIVKLLIRLPSFPYLIYSCSLSILSDKVSVFEQLILMGISLASPFFSLYVVWLNPARRFPLVNYMWKGKSPLK